MPSQSLRPVSARINSQPSSGVRNGAQVIHDDLDEEARADIQFLQIAIDVLMRRGMTYEEILTAIGRAANADQRVGARPRCGPPRLAWRQ